MTPNFINNITMSKTANLMPEGKMNAQLEEGFASFFLEKIEKSQNTTLRH